MGGKYQNKSRVMDFGLSKWMNGGIIVFWTGLIVMPGSMLSLRYLLHMLKMQPSK